MTRTGSVLAFMFGALGIGGVAIGIAKAREQSSTPRKGTLRVTVRFKPPLPMDSASERASSGDLVRRVFTAVPEGLPSSLTPISAFGGDFTWQSTTKGMEASAVFVATWTHATMGPIKASAREALLARLQAVSSRVASVEATRIS